MRTSADRVSNAERNAAIIASLNAFRLSGEFNVRCTTAPRSVRSSNDILSSVGYIVGLMTLG